MKDLEQYYNPRGNEDPTGITGKMRRRQDQLGGMARGNEDPTAVGERHTSAFDNPLGWRVHSISDLLKRSDDLVRENSNRKAVDIARRNELLKLVVELNTLKWVGSDAGWDLAVSALSKHILSIASEIQIDD